MQVTTESLAIELNQTYMRARIRTQMDQPLPATATRQRLQLPESDPARLPTSGFSLNSVNLEQTTDATGTRLNLLAIDLTPWLRKDDPDPADATGNTVKLSKAPVSTRRFVLRLRLVPHLVTATTISDLARRRAILGCDPADQTCAGVVLGLTFHQLYDKGFSENVVCSPTQRSPNYDLISAQVLQGALDTVNGRVIPATTPGTQPRIIPAQAPISVPTKPLLDMVSMLNGTPVSLTGVAVGSDLDLKIALLVNGGMPLPFSPTTGFRNADTDWAIVIDTSFLASKIAGDVVSRAAANSPPITIAAGSVAVAFNPGRVSVSASGFATTAVLHCNVPVSLSLPVTPSVCRKAAGQRVLRMCPGSVVSSNGVTACAFFDAIIGGSATATVTCPTCPPAAPTDPCGPVPIQFEAGTGDTFYATAVDTDNIFYIAGRSTLMDTVLAQSGQTRAAAPAACP
jgi:hypothetical protein